MNYRMTEPPVFTDTLDFENVNAPFIVLGKNQYFLTQKAEKIRNFVSKLDVFTDKDAISLRSNGIKDYFKLGMKGLRLNVYGDILIKSSAYTKDDTPENLITDTTPINMKELRAEMLNLGFLEKNHTYTSLLDKSLLLLSNMVSFSGMESSCIERDVSVVSLVSPECIMSDRKNGTELVDRGTMQDEFIHKILKMDQLNVSSDNVAIARFDSSLAQFIEFENGYEPKIGNDAISIKYGKEHGYIIDEEMRAPVYINNPGNNNSPINKKKAIEFSDMYISKDEMRSVNIIIDRDSPIMESDFVVSSVEAREFIDNYINRILDPSIDSIDEFKGYLGYLCEIGDDYIGYDFAIKGGKVYLGFDYNNMYSIFNSEAIQRVLFEKTGQYDTTLGIVFDASRYFKDQKEIDKLAAYSQQVNFEFDISKDTVAQVFKQIQGIVGKLCMMTPDVVSVDVKPVEVPVFKPNSVILSPSFPSYIVAYTSSYIVAPVFIKEYKPFYFVQPRLDTRMYTYLSNLFIQAPIYFKELKLTIVTPLTLSPITRIYSPVSLKTPYPSGRAEAVSFTREDGVEDRLVIFKAENGCRNRYKVTSTRTVNMMDVGIVMPATRVEGKFFWYDKEESIVMTKPKFMQSLLSDIICKTNEKSDYFFNINIHAGENGGGLYSSTNDISVRCRINEAAEEDDRTIPEKIIDTFDSDFFSLNGVTIDNNGDETGEAIFSETEITDIDTIMSSVKFDGWEDFRGVKYMSVVDEISTKLHDAIEQYVSTRRIDKWSQIEAEDSMVDIVSVNNISRGVFLAEYINVEWPSSPEYDFRSVGDPLGIWSSSLNVSASLIDVVLPYDNILVGNTTGQDAISDRVDYMNSPPSPTPGSNKIYIWSPSIVGNETKIDNFPYSPLDSSSQGVISVFSPTIFVWNNGPIYHYDIAGDQNAEITVGTKEIDVIVYSDGTSLTERRHIITYMGEHTIILGKTDDYATPTPSSFSRDICDPWDSPYKIYGVLDLENDIQVSPAMITYTMFLSMRGTNVKMVNVNSTLNGGCGEKIDDLSSGISTTIRENTSTLEDIDSATLNQAEGETPGAISMILNMQAMKLLPPSANSTADVVETTRVKLCITLGVVDGMKTDDGDILAQGMSQEEIDAIIGSAEPTTYVAPNRVVKDNTSVSRVAPKGKEATKFTMDLESILKDNLISSETGKPFFEYFDPVDGDIKVSDMIIAPDTANMEDFVAVGTVTVGDFSSSGLSYYYKHAGQDPTRPVVHGYQGSSEIDFIGGKKLVATVPSPLPNVIVTNSENADDIIDNMSITSGEYVSVFLNRNNIQFLVPDTKAALSEKRTVKVTWQEN